VPILWSFGIFFPFWYIVTRKIWQPCFAEAFMCRLHWIVIVYFFLDTCSQSTILYGSVAASAIVRAWTDFRL
jgi:hypothetical protein